MLHHNILSINTCNYDQYKNGVENFNLLTANCPVPPAAAIKER